MFTCFAGKLDTHAFNLYVYVGLKFVIFGEKTHREYMCIVK